MGTTRNELFKQAIIIIINKSHISKTSHLSFIMIRRSVYMTGLQTFEKTSFYLLLVDRKNGSFKKSAEEKTSIYALNEQVVFF